MSSSGANTTTPFISLRVQIPAVVVVIVATVTALVYHGLMAQTKSRLLASKQTASEMVGTLFAASIMPAVVFGDPTEIERGVGDLKKNPEVASVEVWGKGDDEKPTLVGHYGPVAASPPEDPTPHSIVGREFVETVEPLIDQQQKPVGIALLRFSLKSENAALVLASRQVLGIAVAVASGLVAALMIVLSRLVIGPLRNLQKAAVTMASGSQRQILSPQSVRISDEVVRLRDAFQDMAMAVADREQRLAARNKDMHVILDNVDQGLLTIEVSGPSSGHVLEERSASVRRWIPDAQTDDSIWQLIERIAPAEAASIEAGWFQLTSDIFPVEVAIDQMPKKFMTGDERTFEMAYCPVYKEHALDKIVVVMTDVSVAVQRQLVEEDQREIATAVEHILRDHKGFMLFWDNASQIVQSVTSAADPPDVLKRNIHTLKGNCRFVGMQRLSSLCHEVEQNMLEEDRDDLTDDERERFRESWEAVQKRLKPFMDAHGAFLEITEDDYERLAAALRARKSHEVIAQVVSEFRYEPTSLHLNRAKDQVESLCNKLAKSIPTTVIEDNGIRLPSDRWAPFWNAFVHVVNNAVDHGLSETTEERTAASKPPVPCLTFRTAFDGEDLVVELRDDGRGIDWSRLTEKARSRGLPHETRQDLIDALHADGVSTRDTATEISGRGVGLAAVAGVVRDLGGTVQVESSLGRNTTFRYVFPWASTQEPTRPSLMPLADKRASDRAHARQL